MENKEDLRGFYPLFGITQVVGGLLCILVLVWSIVHRGGFGWSANPPLQFNWHPLLMTIGMVYLFANCKLDFKDLLLILKNAGISVCVSLNHKKTGPLFLKLLITVYIPD